MVSLITRRPSAALATLPVHRILRNFCSFHLPAHLRVPFYTPLDTASPRCMIVGAPFWRYFLAVVPPEPEVAPLINAIRELDVRPFRIISHVDEVGKVFNASFFENEATMNAFLEWYALNALAPGTKYSACLAAASGGGLPTKESLLFGQGTRVLADTRFGEFQLGMVRVSPRMRHRCRQGLVWARSTTQRHELPFESSFAGCSILPLHTARPRHACGGERAGNNKGV